MILQMAEMRTKRLYIIRPGIDAFLCGIRAVCLYFGINIKLEISVAEKRSLFPTLVDLRKFLRNCSLSTAPSIQSLFKVKLISISTKIASGLGL
jgi:hypothetical protein